MPMNTPKRVVERGLKEQPVEPCRTSGCGECADIRDGVPFNGYCKIHYRSQSRFVGDSRPLEARGSGLCGFPTKHRKRGVCRKKVDENHPCPWHPVSSMGPNLLDS